METASISWVLKLPRTDARREPALLDQRNVNKEVAHHQVVLLDTLLAWDNLDILDSPAEVLAVENVVNLGPMFTRAVGDKV